MRACAHDAPKDKSQQLKARWQVCWCEWRKCPTGGEDLDDNDCVYNRCTNVAKNTPSSTTHGQGARGERSRRLGGKASRMPQ
eukprot:1734351-Alexandrium_andersonii.AAC.1